MLYSVVGRFAVAGLMLAGLLATNPAWAAEPVSVLPSPCVRRGSLEPDQYSRLGRFMTLGGGYRQWEEMDCYPARLDDAALAAIDQPTGRVIPFGSGDAFVVGIDPSWFNRCTRTATPVRGALAIDGAKMLALKEHLAGIAAQRSVDIREIGFAEADMRDRRLLFALYVGTAERNVYLECFEDLDAAVVRAFEELGAARAKP